MRVHRWQSQDQRSQRRRNLTTWCHSARGARREIRRKTWDIQKPKILRRQEKAQSSDSWKQFVQKKSSNSTRTRTLVRVATPRPGVPKQATHEPSVRDEDLPFHAREFGNYSRLLNILNGSIQDKCVHMENVHVFVDESSHASWTELLGELGVLQEHELRGKSERIQYHTEIDFGARLRVLGKDD